MDDKDVDLLSEELLGELSEAEARRVVSLLNILYEPS